MARWTAFASLVWLILFVVSAAIGYSLGEATTPPPSVTSDIPSLDIFWMITRNNLLVLAVLLAGTVTFGISTVIQLSVNAIPSGVLIGCAIQQLGPEWVFRALALHSVIEIPAFLAVAGAGLYGAAVVWKQLSGEVKGARIHASAQKVCRTCIAAAVLMILAAAVETWVTPALLGV